MPACTFRQAHGLVLGNLSQQGDRCGVVRRIQFMKQPFKALRPAAQANGATCQWLAKIIDDFQHMHLAIGQLPRQIDSKAVVTGGAVRQGLVVLFTYRPANHLIAFPYRNLHMSIRCLWIPAPTTDTQAACMPNLGRNRGTVVTGCCRERQLTFQFE
ncbi:hypothetical protein A3K88_18375 [Pseudomonas putida]|nr:hypothetical protein G1E_33075 [Pseudomonas sp. TJI-51]OAK60141.1 hypothetical protein A3K88_18375 [Pseudomonas putida]